MTGKTLLLSLEALAFTVLAAVLVALGDAYNGGVPLDWAHLKGPIIGAAIATALAWFRTNQFNGSSSNGPKFSAIAFLLLTLGAGAALPGCGASLGGPRHLATVGAKTAHGSLMLIDATESKLVCGVTTAPAAPACISDADHAAISGKLADAFALDAQAARTIKALPVGSPTPAELVNVYAQISALITDVLKLIPASTGRAQLEAQLKGQ